MDLSDLINQLEIWAIDSLTAVDLIAASSNAFCGAILVMRPDHRQNWADVGIIGLSTILEFMVAFLFRHVAFSLDWEKRHEFSKVLKTEP